MTETLLPYPTQIANPEDRANSTHHPPLPESDHVDGDGQVKVDDDGTIKCICDFTEDDGSTVLCERCGTWQHSECYYYNNGGVLPDLAKIEHHCIDCKPRHVDHKGAHERQRIRREYLGLEETKVKKPPPTKSHKRKIKLSDAALTNGWSHDRNDSHVLPDRDSRSPKEPGQPTKRPKTNHRPASSTSILSARGLGANNKKTPKPWTNGFTSPTYSEEFFELFERDPGDTPMQANLFSDISITLRLSDWSEHVESLSSATNGRAPSDVFEQCDRPIDQMVLPPLQKQYQEIKSPIDNGRVVKWTYLTTAQPVHRMSPIGELRGKIGDMKEYCNDPSNRWDHLRHPLPFVFFHPTLPIYIDTRHEGTQCRYLRRSCAPNLMLKTFLEGKDYRFCFVAKEDLEAGSELTIGWTLDLHIRQFLTQKGNQEVKRDEIIDQDEAYVADWVEKVLATFGGCACNAPDQCSLARWTRSPRYFTGEHGNGILNGKTKQRKSHKRPNLSEVAAGSGSRASSEGMRNNDDDLMDGNLSTSDSSRSKPRSRDLSPPDQQTTDASTAPGLEISEREKRKIAAIEKSDQLEHERQQPTQKKKKRNSGNTANGSGSMNRACGAPSVSQPNTPGLVVRPFVADAGTGQGSGSPTAKPTYTLTGPKSSNTHQRTSLPNSPLSAHSLPRPSHYVDSAAQTDRDSGIDWIKAPTAIKYTGKPYMSLTKRLLRRCQQERLAEAKLKQQISHDPASSTTEASAESTDTAIANRSTEEKSKFESTASLSNRLGTAAGSEKISTLPVRKPRPPGKNLDSDNEHTEIPDQPSQTGLFKSQEQEATGSGDLNALPSNGASGKNHLQPLQVEPFQPPLANADTQMSSPSVATPMTGIPPTTPLLPQLSAELQSPEHPPGSLSGPPKATRKKVSLSDYMKRKSDRAEADVQASSAEARSSASPTVHNHVPPRPLEALSEDSGDKVEDRNASAAVTVPENDSITRNTEYDGEKADVKMGGVTLPPGPAKPERLSNGDNESK